MGHPMLLPSERCVTAVACDLARSLLLYLHCNMSLLMPVRQTSVTKHALHLACTVEQNLGEGHISLLTCLHRCMQRYIAGLLLVSAAFAAVLSVQPHPYSAVYPKRILLQHVVRLDNVSQVMS